MCVFIFKAALDNKVRARVKSCGLVAASGEKRDPDPGGAPRASKGLGIDFIGSSLLLSFHFAYMLHALMHI